MFVFVAFLIFTGALFAAAWYIFMIPQQAAQQVLAGRLRELRARTGSRTKGSSDLLRREQRGSLAYLGDFVGWIAALRRLQTYIDQANLKSRAAEVAALCVLISIGSYFLLGLFGMPPGILRVLFTVGFGALPILYIRRKRNRRIKKFEENFPDAIDLFTRSMKAGHTIHSGLETISQETLDPVRMEFRKVVEELALGAPIEDALRSLGQRIPIVDLKFFVTGLILQRQTGANMMQVLENLALLVRERLNLAAKMKAATAQQRFSAGLLCTMPVVVGLGFWVLKPEYIRLLYTDETGIKFLTYAIISEIVGILIIRKIANPKF